MEYTLQTNPVLLLSSALLTAMGVHDLFPGLIPIQGQIEEQSFSYDFLVKTAYPGDLRKLIQEKIDILIRQDIEFDVKSMMRENAITYLEHRNFQLQAKLVESREENVVELCHICKFIALCQGKTVSHCKELKEIGITEIRNFVGFYPHLGEVKVLRVIGVVADDQRSLRKYFKLEKQAQENDPVAVCERLSFIKLSQNSGFRPVWKSRGLELIEPLFSLWKEEALKRGFELVKTAQFIEAKSVKRRTISPLEELFPFDCEDMLQFEEENRLFTPNSYGDAHAELFQEKKSSETVRFAEMMTKDLPLYTKDLEGLFRPKAIFGDVQHIFCKYNDLKREIISSLQFIQEMFKLLGFDLRYVLELPREKKESRAQDAKLKDAFVSAINELSLQSEIVEVRLLLPGPRLEVRAKDMRGRYWLVSVLGVDQELAVKHDLKLSETSSEFVCVLAQSYLFSLERIVALFVEKGNVSLNPLCKERNQLES